MMRDAGIDPDPHQVGLLLDRWQQALVLFPRQTGKSQTNAARVLHQAYFDPGDIVILAGEKQKQAKEVWNKAFAMHETLTELGQVPTCEKVDDELRFGNGTRVLAVPSTVESIRGYSAKLVIVDEAAFTGEDTLAKVAPMLSAKKGRLICSSTPNGARGWFWDAWHNGGDAWSRHTVAIEHVARIGTEEIERQRALLTPLQFRQEFLLEWLDADEQFFPTETIEGALCDEIVPLFERLAA